MASFFASFGQYFVQSFKAVFSRFWIFSQLVLVFTAAEFGIGWFAQSLGLDGSELSFSWQNFPLYLGLIIFGFVISIIFTLCFTYASNEILHHRPVHFGGVFSFSFKNLRRGLATFFRIMWFFVKYFVLIGLAIAVFSLIAMLIGSFLLSKSDFAEKMPLFSLIATALSFLIAFPFVLYRVAQAQFAYYFLIDKNTTPKESLQESILTIKKNIWAFLGYMILYGIIAFALLLLIGSLTGYLSGESAVLFTDERYGALIYSSPKMLTLNFFLELLGGFVGMAYILFMNLTYLRLKS